MGSVPVPLRSVRFEDVVGGDRDRTNAFEPTPTWGGSLEAKFVDMHVGLQVPSEKVRLGWVPGGSSPVIPKLRRYDEVGVGDKPRPVVN